MNVTRQLALLAVLGALSLLSPTLVAQEMPGSGAGAQAPATQGERVISRKRLADAIDLYKAGKTAEAITAIEAVRASDPGYADASKWLGFLYIMTERAAEAVPLLEEAYKSAPNDLELLNNLGNAYLKTGNEAAAVTKFEAMARMAPKEFEPHYNLGTIYLKQKEWAKAVTELRRAAALKPGKASIYNNLGVASNEAQDVRGAAEAFKKASDLEPKNALFARNAGITLAKLKSPNAMTYLERAIANGSDEAVVRLTLGQAYTDAKRYPDAERVYSQAAREFQQDPNYWFNLGVLRGKMNDSGGAESAYRRALELRPEDTDALQNLGLVLFTQGKYEEARQQFSAQRKLDPDSLDARRNFAAAAARSGHPEEAIDVWKEIVHAEPNNVLARVDLANALYASNDVAGAKYHYTIALKLKSTSAEALNGMGLIHLHDDQLVPAEAAFRGAIQSNPKLVAAYNNLAIVLEKSNKRAQAIAILERAVKLDPNNSDVQRNLRRLKGAV